MKIALNVELTREGMLYLSKLGSEEAQKILKIFEFDAITVEEGKNATPWECFYYRCAPNIKRNDPLLIQTIENLGKKAAIYEGWKKWLEQKIVEIPDDIEWFIDNNEGQGDVIHEEHRTWS